jgi:hypothetical protein
MCGRFTWRRRDLQAVRRELRDDSDGGSILWEPRYNIARANRVPILIRRETGGWRLGTITQGGLIL